MTKLAHAAARWAAAVAIGAAVGASPAASYLPKAERIARAVAKENRSASRTQALRLSLSLRVGDREPIATGTLVTHPNGLARLELVDASQIAERHLLLGTEHVASRGGQEVSAPRRFLPPLFLLQAPSQLQLEQALSDFGLDVDAVALAPCGSRVCYVLGDPARVPPPPRMNDRDLANLRDAEASGAVDVAQAPSVAPGNARSRGRDAAESRPHASVWLDTTSFEIVRIEPGDGVEVELGPVVAFGKVRLPDSITIREPDKEPVRLDVLSVTPVNAPAAEFTRSWLLAPASELPTAPSP